jgi:hypothetical protein
MSDKLQMLTITIKLIKVDSRGLTLSVTGSRAIVLDWEYVHEDGSAHSVRSPAFLALSSESSRGVPRRRISLAGLLVGFMGVNLGVQ